MDFSQLKKDELVKELNELNRLIPRDIQKDNSSLVTKFKTYIDLYENSPDMFFSVSTNGITLSVNDTGVRILGYSKKELINKPVWKVIHPDDLKEVKSKLAAFVKSKKQFGELGFRKVTKAGRVIHVLERTQLIFNASGEVSEIRITCRDITERKEAEKKLKSQEEKYRNMANHLNVGLYRSTTEEDGKFVEVNPAFLSIFGFESKEDLFSFHVSDLYVNKSDRLVLQQAVKKDGLVKNKELLLKKKDGAQFTGSVSTVAILDNEGNVAYYNGIVEDITERKQATEKIIRKEEQYRTLFNFSPSGILLEDGDGFIKDVNPAFCKMLGYKRNEIMGKNVVMFAHKDTEEEVKNNIKELLDGKNLVHVVKSIKKNGEVIYVELNERKFQLPDGSFGILCIVNDVTESKLAEEALIISEISYRGLFNNTTDAIYILDENACFIDVNDGAVKMYGYEKDYFKGKTPAFLSAPGKNDMEDTVKKINLAFLGQPQIFNFWGLAKNGRVFPKEVRLNAGDYFGRKVIVAFAQDITERKKVELEIQESRRRLETLLGNLQGMAYRCYNDKNWTMQFVSAFVKELTGYTQDDLIDNKKLAFADLMHPGDQKRVWDKIQEKIKDRDVFKVTYRIFDKDKKMKWVWEQGTGVFDAEGNLLFLEGFISDITDQVESEKEIRKLSRSVEQSPTIVVIADLDARIEYVNPKFTKVTGYEPSEVIGKKPSILKSGQTPDETYANLWSSVTAGKDWYGEFHNRKKNGEVYWESAHIFPLKDEKGSITHFIGMKEDITERKRMENDLIKAKEKAEESDKLKSAFLANMSHEIRTPMNSIIGFSQLLNEPDISEEEREHYIKLIQNSGSDLLNLIDDIIDISKIEAGQMKIFKSQYFLDNLMQELHVNFAEFLKTKPDKANVKLNYKANDSSGKVMIYTDVDRFKQIFRNLINNAIKFTDFGKVEFGFDHFPDAQEPFIQFYVRDTGIGVSQDKLDLIFKPFTQANDSDTRLYGGTGLGLAITKKIVSVLGGEIWVKSVPGQGSTFYFTLPYQEVSLANQKSKNIETIEPRESHTWPTKKVLCVEDDDKSYLFFQTLLKKTRLQVKRAKDGKEAVEMANAEDFDLVLMDVQIPKLNGLDATKEIKRTKPNLPVIAQTAYAMEGERENCLQAGCDEYLTKPVIKSTLFQLLQKFLG